MKRFLALLPLACLLAATTLAAPADPPKTEGATRKHHCWGRFEPGAWKLVRVVTETLNEKGEVINTSTTDTRTILTSVDKDGVTLEVHTTVEVAGKRFDTEPQTIRQGFHGETLVADCKSKNRDDVELTIDGRKVAAHAQQIDFTGPNAGNKTTATVYYSDTVSPFVLKRESTTTDAEGKSVLNETTLEVESLGMPWKAGTKLHPSAIVKTVSKHPKGQITTWSVTSAEIPGGVISNTSKEIDKSGRLVRRSSLELLDHGLSCDEEQVNIWGRIKRRPVRVREQ